MKLPKLEKKAWFDIAVLVTVIIVLILVRGPIGKVISPFIYALVLAYILSPLVKLLEKRGMKRIWAILTIFLVLIGIIVILFITIIPSLTNDLSVFINDIPRIFEFFKGFIEDMRAGEISFIPKQIQEFLNIDQEITRISDYFKNAMGGILNFLAKSTGTLLDIIITPLITFYYLKDKDRLLGAIGSLIPIKWRKVMGELKTDAEKVLGGFIKGQITVAIFVGILTGIGCKIIGVPYSITIGFVAGLTNIIPYFGPWLGGLLPVILALMERPIMALWVLGLILVIQQIEASFISPQIMSNSVGLHPLTVIFSVLFFGSMMGIPGMIIGVPLMGVLKAIAIRLSDYRKSLEAGKDKTRVAL